MGRKGACALICGVFVLATGAAASGVPSRPTAFPVERVARVLARTIARDAAARGAVQKRCCGVRVSRIHDVVKVSRADTVVTYALALETRGGAIQAISVSESGSESGKTAGGATVRSDWSFGFVLGHRRQRPRQWELILSAGDASSTIPSDPSAPSEGIGGFKECGGSRTTVPRGLYEQVLGVIARARRARLGLAQSFPDSYCGRPAAHGK